jgi:hypothetical protein
MAVRALALKLAVVGLLLVPVVPVVPVVPDTLPSRFSDRAFWNLSAGASEPGGYFRSQDITNLTSNELGFQLVIPELVRRTRPGGVYLGVGPEQNFTYIAAVRPKLAIIFDIRRGNLGLHLMYKALFELARDRAEFLAMLFARPPLAGVGADATADDLFRALARTQPTDAIVPRHLTAIERRLRNVHGFPLRPGDLSAIHITYETFAYSGVAVRAYPTYADLMTAADEEGTNRSFLATEEAFAFVKDLQTRNLIVPVVGDFAGPKAIRTIGSWLRGRDAVVSAFYLSNVEQYLPDWNVFCRNVRALPIDRSSTFIRSTSGGGFGGFRRGGNFVSSLGAMTTEVEYCGP